MIMILVIAKALHIVQSCNLYFLACRASQSIIAFMWVYCIIGSVYQNITKD